jgi:response regulator RpfG family c-di-GMP phosphodiesterase
MIKILVVDDKPQNLYMLEVLFSTNGYDVEKAINGIEALEAAHKTPPDVVISDILMPGMDGFSLCKSWMADDQLKNIPFVFYTATYTDTRDKEFAMSLGAERFIVKPVDGDTMLAIVQDVIRNRSNKQTEVKNADIEKKDEFYKVYNETLIRKLEDKMMQLEKSNKRLTSLYNISSDIHIRQATSSLIKVFLETTIRNAGYYHANYFLFNENDKKLYLYDSTGFLEGTYSSLKERLIFNLGEKSGLVGIVAQEKQIINIADTSRNPDWINLDPSIKSALFMPVHFEKKILGVIAVFSEKINAFTEEDEHAIEVLSNHLAIAIENNTNQEKVSIQLNRISALYNIDLAISSGSDLNATLNILLKNVMDLLNIDAADVLLSNKNTLSNDFMVGLGFKTDLIKSETIRKGNSLDKKVTIENRIIQITDLKDQLASAEFMAMWKEEGFLTYIGVPLITKDRLVGVLGIFQRSKFEADPEWMDYLKTIAGQAAIAIDNATLVMDLKSSTEQLLQAYDATIEGWSRAMDLRDKETEGHTLRVTDITLRLAWKMGMSEEKLIHVKRGALLHDIGKLGIPDHILLKPGPLTEEEWVIMRTHPASAYNLIAPIEYLKPAIAIPYCHHEKWDGTGYPRGLKGEEIPLEARFFAVVDVWDALSSDRPYRAAWEREKVLAYIKENSGTHFEPRVVGPFIQLIENMGSSQ